MYTNHYFTGSVHVAANCCQYSLYIYTKVFLPLSTHLLTRASAKTGCSQSAILSIYTHVL